MRFSLLMCQNTRWKESHKTNAPHVCIYKLKPPDHLDLRVHFDQLPYCETLDKYQSCVLHVYISGWGCVCARVSEGEISCSHNSGSNWLDCFLKHYKKPQFHSSRSKFKVLIVAKCSFNLLCEFVQNLWSSGRSCCCVRSEILWLRVGLGLLHCWCFIQRYFCVCVRVCVNKEVASWPFWIMW